MVAKTTLATIFIYDKFAFSVLFFTNFYHYPNSHRNIGNCTNNTNVNAKNIIIRRNSIFFTTDIISDSVMLIRNDDFRCKRMSLLGCHYCVRHYNHHITGLELMGCSSV